MSTSNNARVVINAFILNEYETLLKAHDWTYEYSDDFRVWTRGREEYHKLVGLRTRLIESGLRKEADEYWNKHATHERFKIRP